MVLNQKNANYYFKSAGGSLRMEEAKPPTILAAGARYI